MAIHKPDICSCGRTQTYAEGRCYECHLNHRARQAWEQNGCDLDAFVRNYWTTGHETARHVLRRAGVRIGGVA